MEWMIAPYKRYADFEGRSRRMEYWMFRLFEFGAFVIWIVFSGLLAGGIGAVGGDTAGGLVGGLMTLLLMVFLLGSFVPSLAVTVRRLHDTDRSGWMMLISLVPLVGPIAMLVFMFSEGTRGENQYGPDPKNPQFSADVFS